MNEIQKTDASVQVFNNSNFGEVRTSWIGEKPFFCLTDICRSLELDNPSYVKTRLDPKGVVINYTLTAGGMQNLLFVNEPNLYRCVFQSRKENAIVFQNWIFEEVIPEIRKTGGYGKQMSKAEMRLQVFLDMQSEISRQSNVIKKQGKRITALLAQIKSDKEAKKERLLIEKTRSHEDLANWLSTAGFSGRVSLNEIYTRYKDHCINNGMRHPVCSILGKMLVLLEQERVRIQGRSYYLFSL